MIVVEKNILDSLSDKAKQSKRKRINFNFHETFDDPLQRMLNAIEPGSYIQPHKHENPDKRESFWVIRGRLLVVLFDNTGCITEKVILDRNSETYGVEIKPRIWHSIISLETGTVAYEVKDGPYNPNNDKNFAIWAPDENGNKANEYLNHLISLCL